LPIALTTQGAHAVGTTDDETLSARTPCRAASAPEASAQRGALDVCAGAQPSVILSLARGARSGEALPPVDWSAV